jgi:tRNA-2-methylthio-N6-dimethylallyladenosine synthase
MEDHIPDEEKTRRIMILQERQRAIQMRRNVEFVGEVEEVNVEGRYEHLNQWVGRTSRNRTIAFSDPSNSGSAHSADLVGKYVHVRITRAGPSSLSGETVQ